MKFDLKSCLVPVKKRKGHDTDCRRTNICFDCEKACGGCSWSSAFKPVKGWTAEPSTISVYHNGIKTKTWHITACPEFLRTPPHHSQSYNRFYYAGTYFPPYVDEKIRMRQYKSGMTDAELAFAWGLQSASSVGSWRARRNLPPNSPRTKEGR